MSTGEKNKALVCRFLEAQSTGDLEALDELLAPDFVDHGLLPGQDPGREGFMQGRHWLWPTKRCSPASPQHVRHLLLRHPGARER